MHINKIPSIVPDSAIDTNTDCSSCSEPDDVDPIDDFRQYSSKITNNFIKDWTQPEILKKLIEKQTRIEKNYSLAMYFGGNKPQELHEIGKEKEAKSSRQAMRKNKYVKSQMCNSFATPTAKNFSEFSSQFKSSKTGLYNKKCTNQGSSSNILNSAYGNKDQKKNYKNLKISPRVDYVDKASFRGIKTPGS